MKDSLARRSGWRMFFFGLTHLTLWMSWLATLCCVGATLWWPLELATHFRLQYAVTFTVCIAGSLAFRAWGLTALAVGGWLVHAFVLYPTFFTPRPVTTQKSVVRGMVVNLNSQNRRPELLVRLIQKRSPHVVVLLEFTHRWSRSIHSIRKSYPHSTLYPRSDNFGLAFLSRYPATVTFPVIGEGEFPSLVAGVQTPRGKLTIIGTHPMPPIGRTAAFWRNDQLDKMARRIRGVKGPVMLVGDLNTSPWSPYFGKFLKDSGLRDGALGFGFQPTWPVGILPLYTSIDHTLVSHGLTMKHRTVGPDIGSDHYPLWFELVF